MSDKLRLKASGQGVADDGSKKNGSDVRVAVGKGATINLTNGFRQGLTPIPPSDVGFFWHGLYSFFRDGSRSHPLTQ